ncbi:MAG: radical SAM protein [Thermodesulfobacteriota bacterium]|nr:radical SAM protein [Thermodesulfobacteriota bacterium]
MKKESRRQFFHSCFYLGLAGFSSTLIPFFTGWRQEANSISLPGSLENEHKERHRVAVKKKTGPDFEPAYLKLHRSGELARIREELWSIMRSCELCPRMCGAGRLDGDEGFCQASAQLEISAYHPHFGEERSLVGNKGSGTIFLTNCGLRCVFCINWDISQGRKGSRNSIEDMAAMMLKLQKMGCHNINFVTPTHYTPHIVAAVDKAAGKGLRLPIVYNSCGWERPEILKKLDGIIDIYLPDFKYFDCDMAAKYSSDAETYPEITRAALLEMHRQVGTAKPAEDGLMYRGLMIRHLVMPNRVSGTKKVIEWIAENLPKDTYLNIMSQYRPMYKAFEYSEISRKITREEYSEAIRWAKEAGLTNLDIQGWFFW